MHRNFVRRGPESSVRYPIGVLTNPTLLACCGKFVLPTILVETSASFRYVGKLGLEP